jgi:outer membrane usher protein
MVMMIRRGSPPIIEAWLAAALLAVPAAAASESGAEPLLLSVSVNGEAMPDAQLILQDAEGRLYASGAAFRLWRLKLPQVETIDFDGQTFHRLAAGLRATLVPADQSLVLNAAPDLFERQRAAFGDDDEPPMTPAGFGGFANYDLFVERAQGTSLSGSTELGLFSRLGVGTASFIGRTGAGPDRLRRLETRWTIDRPGRMTSLRIGDGISAGGPNAPPVRFAGLQLARNFAMRSGFVTMPLPGVRGSAAVPSVADVYVNNVLQGSRQVAPGPFDVTGVPLQSGGGSLQLVVRDLLGRETVTTQNYYVSSGMLRKGLHDFSYEAGFLRRDFGLASNHYGGAMASADHRYGLTETITVEGHAAATRSQALAGAGVTTAIGNLGLVTASATFSESARGGGAALALAAERRTQGLSFGARGEAASRDYAFIGMPRDAGTPIFTGQAFADLRIGAGSVGISYLHRGHRDRDDEAFAGAFARVGLGRAGTLQVYARHATLGGERTTFGAFFAVPLGGRLSGSASIERGRRGRNRATLSLQQDAPIGVGSGYRATATLGAAERLDTSYTFGNSTATFGAQSSLANGGAAVRLSMAGALGLVGGQAFASRRLGASFAAVKLDGLPNVRVYADNLLIGRTNAKGALIIPTMRAFERNTIRIEDADLPIDVQLPETELEVRPYARSGTVIRFAPHRERGVLLRVALGDGSPLPAGAIVTVDAASTRFVALPGGEVYIPELSGRTRLTAAWDGHRCRFEATVPPGDDPQPHLDGLVCREGEVFARR